VTALTQGVKGLQPLREYSKRKGKK
jgi:hypothetical protein